MILLLLTHYKRTLQKRTLQKPWSKEYPKNINQMGIPKKTRTIR